MNFCMVVMLCANVCAAQPQSVSARQAWDKLVGGRSSNRPPFTFVEHQEGLTNVLIYGDSISIAYTPEVRKILAGKANVYRLHANGGDSSSFVEKMETLRATMRDARVEGRWTFEWDVIHFNVGLHDLKYVVGRKLDKVNGKQVTSIIQYEENLRKIVGYLRKRAPHATLIFATTTPVPDGEPGRFAGEAAKYNDVALKVMRDYPKIIINDLYAFTKPKHAKWWSKPGNVHFNPTGVQAQGAEVARVIRTAIDKR